MQTNLSRKVQDYLVPIYVDEEKFGGNYSDVRIGFRGPDRAKELKPIFDKSSPPQVWITSDNWYYDQAATSGHSPLARISALGGTIGFPEETENIGQKLVKFELLTASVPKDCIYVQKLGAQVSITSSLSQISSLNDIDVDGGEKNEKQQQQQQHTIDPDAQQALYVAELENKWTLERNLGIETKPNDMVSLHRKVVVGRKLILVEISVPACCIYFMNTSGLWGSIMPCSFGKHVELGPVVNCEIVNPSENLSTLATTVPIGVDIHMIIQPLSKVLNTLKDKVGKLVPKKKKGPKVGRKPKKGKPVPSGTGVSTGQPSSGNSSNSTKNNNKNAQPSSKNGNDNDKMKPASVSETKGIQEGSLTHTIVSATANGITMGVLNKLDSSSGPKNEESQNQNTPKAGALSESLRTNDNSNPNHETSVEDTDE